MQWQEGYQDAQVSANGRQARCAIGQWLPCIMQHCMHTAFSSSFQVPTVQLICWADDQMLHCSGFLFATARDQSRHPLIQVRERGYHRSEQLWLVHLYATSAVF